MKKILFVLLFVSGLTKAQDSTFVRQDPQGNGTVLYEVSKFKDGQLIDKYNSTENPNKPDWKNLKLQLFRSVLFQRALAEANPNVYSTLLKVITDGESGNADEQNFLMLLSMLGITFSDSEKIQLNGYFEANNFTIRL